MKTTISYILLTLWCVLSGVITVTSMNADNMFTAFIGSISLMASMGVAIKGLED